MNSSVFSLCLLPENTRLQVIRSFDYVNLIAFSLISIKTKAIVKSFNFAIETLAVSIQRWFNRDSLTLDLVFDDVYYDGASIKFEIYEHTNEEKTPEDPLVGLGEVSEYVYYSSNLDGYSIEHNFEWVNPGLSFTGWFEHFRYLFKLKKSCFNFCTQDEIFDTVAIRNLFPEWTGVRIERASCSYAEKIFELFLPCPKQFDTVIIEGLSTFPKKVGILNSDKFRTFHPLKLDYLLNLNARDITVHNFSISNANRFFKFWAKGSNQRMETLSMNLTEEGSEETLFKGIAHQTMPRDLERMKGNRVVRGGFDIRSEKGILATIEKCYRFSHSIRMTVWD